VPVGGTATFTVTAAGDAPLSYRWQKNGADLSDGGKISGATTPTLVITNCDSTDAAGYRCVVTNPYGSATSNVATLTIVNTLFIVESRTGGQNVNKYSETGTWANSGAKSGAEGCTSGIGSRYGSTYRSVAGEKHALFDADLPAAGTYEVFVTWGNGANRRSGIQCRVTHAAGTTNLLLDQTGAPDVWVSLGQFTFNAGTNVGRVDINNTTTDVSGSMYADAVKWVYVAGLPAPSITQHPSPQAVCPGGTAQFSVTASGTGLSYQWQKNAANLSDGGHYSGTTTPTLTISNASTADAADYRCVVTNAGGSVTSNPAALTLRAATAITQNPASLAVCPGSPAQFTVVAVGDGPLTYRWQKDGADLADDGHYSGTATAVLTVSQTQAGDVGAYRCVVTGGCGTAASTEALLSLKSPTVITGDPAPRAACPGSQVQFTVTATGSGPLTWRWQRDGVDLSDGGGISGSATATLTIDPVSAAHAGSYACVVTGDCGSATSAAAGLTVWPLVRPDFGADCDVDLNDFAVFQMCFNGANQPPASSCPADADFDDDGDVDVSDFAVFQACFNGPDQPPACPE